jgi:hypothetical protein
MVRRARQSSCESVGRDLKEGWKGTKQAMRDFVSGEQCRRIVLDREMDDRVNRPGCEIGEERCDVCQERPRGTRKFGIAVGHRNEGDEEGEEEEVTSKKINSGLGGDFDSEELGLPPTDNKHRDKRRDETRVRVMQFYPLVMLSLSLLFLVTVVVIQTP